MKLNEQEDRIYSTPVAKSIVLEKHETFANEIAKTFSTPDNLPYSFTKTNLQYQMQHRVVLLIADPSFDLVGKR